MRRTKKTRARAEDRVFNAILDAVLDHRLAPGTKLRERELAELFGVSRNAVRTALTRLGHNLLVELRPNRGAIIANPTPAETRDLFEARRVIEAAAIERLARGLTARKLAELRGFVAEEQEAYKRGDRKTGKRLSIRFHKVLSEAAGNALLDRYLGELIGRTPLLTFAHHRAGLGYCGAAEHRSIVEALARRDAALAVQRMNAHLANLERQLLVGEAPQLPATLAAALSSEVPA